MSSPYTITQPFTLVISDRGVAIPAVHAGSHKPGGTDPLVDLELSQITDAGTIASQDANAVSLTGGAIAGVTITMTTGTVNGVVIGGVTPAAATFTTLIATAGSLDGVVIGASDPEDGFFNDIEAVSLLLSGGLTVDSLTLNTALPLASGGTGATGAASARVNLGLDSMATQSSSNVSITGGTLSGVTVSMTSGAIDGVIIGGTTPAAGTFTAVTSSTGTFTGAVTIQSLTLTNKLPVAQGGTGASTVLGAQQGLDLEPGVDVQAYSAKLAAIHTLTWAADKVPYFTGTGTLATADLPSFGRTLIANTTKELARADLGFTEWTGSLTAGQAVVSDASIASTSWVIPIATSSSVNAGHLDVALVAGVGFTITSTDNLDDRSIRALIVY